MMTFRKKFMNFIKNFNFLFVKFNENNFTVGIKTNDIINERIFFVKNKFNYIFKDLHNKTVKLHGSNKPLCTGGVSPTLSDGIAVQIYFPSSEFPYYVELDERVKYPFSNYLETTYNLSEDEMSCGTLPGRKTQANSDVDDPYIYAASNGLFFF